MRITIGDLVFCAKIVAQNRAIALKLMNQLSEVGSVTLKCPVIAASVWWFLQIGALVEIHSFLISG